MKSDAQIREQLTRDFYVTMTFFKLPIEVRKVALESANRSWRSAARCYRAIVNSLPCRALAPDRTSVPHVDEKSGGGWVPLPHGLHPDTVELVLTFAFRLASKLRKAELKYGYDNGWKNEDWMDECRAKLREHMVKGDPIDVAAYCAFLMWHGASTATLAPDRTAAPSGGQPPTKTDSQESPAGEYLAAAVAVEPVAWIWHYPSGNSSLRWRPDHDPTSSDVPERVTPLYVALAPDRTAAVHTCYVTGNPCGTDTVAEGHGICPSADGKCQYDAATEKGVLQMNVNKEDIERAQIALREVAESVEIGTLSGSAIVMTDLYCADLRRRADALMPSTDHLVADRAGLLREKVK